MVPKTSDTKELSIEGNKYYYKETPYDEQKIMQPKA